MPSAPNGFDLLLLNLLALFHAGATHEQDLSQICRSTIYLHLTKECRDLQEEQVASFFQAYFGPICQLVISPEIVVIRVKSLSLFMALGQNRDKPSTKYQN